MRISAPVRTNDVGVGTAGSIQRCLEVGFGHAFLPAAMSLLDGGDKFCAASIVYGNVQTLSAVLRHAFERGHALRYIGRKDAPVTDKANAQIAAGRVSLGVPKILLKQVEYGVYFAFGALCIIFGRQRIDGHYLYADVAAILYDAAKDLCALHMAVFARHAALFCPASVAVHYKCNVTRRRATSAFGAVSFIYRHLHQK